MPSVTQAANVLLQAALRHAAVESYGLSHQTLILEFRDQLAQDHLLSFDTQVTSNIEVGQGLALSEEERALLLFHQVNLHSVTEVECDEQANLVIHFDHGMYLRFSGNPVAEVGEPWQVGSNTPLEAGGYLVVALQGGGYAIWNNTDAQASMQH